MMKNLSLIVTLLLCTVIFFSFISFRILNNNGAPAGYSGSGGDNGLSCTSCHNGTPTPVSNWISGDFPVSGYAPGDTYNIHLSGYHTGVGRFGFEITAEDASDQKKGTFLITNAAETQLAGGNYVTHTANGTMPSADARSWDMKWIAPPANAGDITFFAAFNAANGNGNVNGDIIYTSQLQVAEDKTTAADRQPDPQQEWLVWPNPSDEQLFIRIPGKSAATEVALFDLTGRQLPVDVSVTGGETLKMNLAGLPAGTYILRCHEGDNRFSEEIIISRNK